MLFPYDKRVTKISYFWHQIKYTAAVGSFILLKHNFFFSCTEDQQCHHQRTADRQSRVTRVTTAISDRREELVQVEWQGIELLTSCISPV